MKTEENPYNPVTEPASHYWWEETRKHPDCVYPAQQSKLESFKSTLIELSATATKEQLLIITKALEECPSTSQK
jgi:hypothetical protein